MAVTSSAPISITNLVTEFGGSTPHALTEYYRGGSLVPNNSDNQSVPTSGAISLTNFFGATATSGTDDHTIQIQSTTGAIGEQYFGFFSSTVGSISPTQIELTGFNVGISGVYYATPIFGGAVFFSVSSSGSVGNSGWASMTIGSTTYTKSTATYLPSSSGATWRWVNESSNPIGTSGTQTVSWAK